VLTAASGHVRYRHHGDREYENSVRETHRRRLRAGLPGHPPSFEPPGQELSDLAPNVSA